MNNLLEDFVGSWSLSFTRDSNQVVTAECGFITQKKLRLLALKFTNTSEITLEELKKILYCSVNTIDKLTLQGIPAPISLQLFFSSIRLLFQMVEAGHLAQTQPMVAGIVEFKEKLLWSMINKLCSAISSVIDQKNNNIDFFSIEKSHYLDFHQWLKTYKPIFCPAPSRLSIYIHKTKAELFIDTAETFFNSLTTISTLNPVNNCN